MQSGEERAANGYGAAGGGGHLERELHAVDTDALFMPSSDEDEPPRANGRRAGGLNGAGGGGHGGGMMGEEISEIEQQDSLDDEEEEERGRGWVRESSEEVQLRRQEEVLQLMQVATPAPRPAPALCGDWRGIGPSWNLLELFVSSSRIGP